MWINKFSLLPKLKVNQWLVIGKIIFSLSEVSGMFRQSFCCFFFDWKIIRKINIRQQSKFDLFYSRQQPGPAATN